MRELIVKHLRLYGPMSGPDLAAQLGWAYVDIAKALISARQMGLVAVVGKASYAYIYAAAQTAEWPGRAA